MVKAVNYCLEAIQIATFSDGTGTNMCEYEELRPRQTSLAGLTPECRDQAGVVAAVLLQTRA